MIKAQLLQLRTPTHNHGLKDEALFKEKRREKDILKTMDEDTYEELVASWAYCCLKERPNSYEDVLRLGGAGDGGIDVIAFIDQKTEIFDIYQCKHYKDAISLSKIIVELGKVLYNIYNGYISMPRYYYLMCPTGLSSNFATIYTSATRLKETILSKWNKDISCKISKGACYELTKELSWFLESFDFSIFKFYSPDKFLDDIRGCKHLYHQYFGCNVSELRKAIMEPPKECDNYESKYIEHLIEAYNDAENSTDITLENVVETRYSKHYARSREEFWLAEAVKKFSSENCPGDTDDYTELEDDVHSYVADIYEDTYDNAFARVKAVTNEAKNMKTKQRIISGEVGPRELKGVCFQLSNKDVFVWKEKY